MKTAGALLFVTLSVTLTAMGHNAAAQSDLAGDILLDDAYFEQFDAANTAGLLKNAPIREAAHQKIQGQAPPRPFDGATGVSSLSTGMGGVIENGSFTWTMEDMALSKVTFDADGNPLSSYTTTAGRQMDTMRKLEIGPFSKESDRSQDFSRSVDANGDSYFSRYDFYVDGVHRAHLEFNPDGTIRTGWVKNADGSINSSWTPRAEEPSSASARPPSGGARGSQRSPRPRVQVTKLGGGNIVPIATDTRIVPPVGLATAAAAAANAQVILETALSAGQRVRMHSVNGAQVRIDVQPPDAGDSPRGPASAVVLDAGRNSVMEAAIVRGTLATNPLVGRFVVMPLLPAGTVVVLGDTGAAAAARGAIEILAAGGKVMANNLGPTSVSVHARDTRASTPASTGPAAPRRGEIPAHGGAHVTRPSPGYLGPNIYEQQHQYKREIMELEAALLQLEGAKSDARNFANDHPNAPLDPRLAQRLENAERRVQRAEGTVRRFRPEANADELFRTLDHESQYFDQPRSTSNAPTPVRMIYDVERPTFDAAPATYSLPDGEFIETDNEMGLAGLEQVQPALDRVIDTRTPGNSERIGGDTLRRLTAGDQSTSQSSISIAAPGDPLTDPAFAEYRRGSDHLYPPEVRRGVLRARMKHATKQPLNNDDMQALSYASAVLSEQGRAAEIAAARVDALWTDPESLRDPLNDPVLNEFRGDKDHLYPSELRRRVLRARLKNSMNVPLTREDLEALAQATAILAAQPRAAEIQPTETWTAGAQIDANGNALRAPFLSMPIVVLGGAGGGGNVIPGGGGGGGGVVPGGGGGGGGVALGPLAGENGVVTALTGTPIQNFIDFNRLNNIMLTGATLDWISDNPTWFLNGTMVREGGTTNPSIARVTGGAGQYFGVAWTAGSVNAGLHLVYGAPTPVAQMPTNGTFTYNFISTTSPTYSNGSTAPGTLTGSAVVDFASLRVGVAMTATMPNETFTIQTPGGTANPAASAVAISDFAGQRIHFGLGNFTTSAVRCAAGCLTSIGGHFFGANALFTSILFNTLLGGGVNLTGAALGRR